MSINKNIQEHIDCDYLDGEDTLEVLKKNIILLLKNLKNG